MPANERDTDKNDFLMNKKHVIVKNVKIKNALHLTENILKKE